MRYRVTHTTYSLITGGTLRRPGDEWECDQTTLPEWDALHGALRRGLVACVCDSASTSAPEPASEQDAGPDLDELSRVELWRLYDGDELSYRSATRDDLIAALRGE